jgi:dihydroxyacid dehydratase/phosphogluconate dehydratase
METAVRTETLVEVVNQNIVDANVSPDSCNKNYPLTIMAGSR